MHWHEILSILVAIPALIWFLQGANMATRQQGMVNNQELAVVLAMIANKVIGCLYVIGCLITLAILLI